MKGMARRSGMVKRWRLQGKTVVRLGEWTEKGLEEAEVHWPGKERKASKGKVWKYVEPFSPNTEAEEEPTVARKTNPALGNSSTYTRKLKRRVSCETYKLQEQLAVLKHKKKHVSCQRQ